MSVDFGCFKKKGKQRAARGPGRHSKLNGERAGGGGHKLKRLFWKKKNSNQ